MAMIRRKRCRRARGGWLGSDKLWTSAVTGIVAAVLSANAKAPAPTPNPPQAERSALAAPLPPPSEGRFEFHLTPAADEAGPRPVRLGHLDRPRWPEGPFDR